jgi:hypothetical protein
MLTILALTNPNNPKKKAPTEENIKELHPRAGQDISELKKRGVVVEREDEYHIFSPIFSQWISLEISAAPGEEETPDTVEEWLQAGGDEKLQLVKNVFPKFKKKYWNTIGIIVKDISIDIIEKVTVEMIMRGI